MSAPCSQFNRIERAHGSRWLAVMFTIIIITAGAFAGCEDVEPNITSCGTCGTPPAKFDTSAIVDDKRFDTVYHPGDFYAIDTIHNLDTLIRNETTGDTVHLRGRTFERGILIKREPIRDATISIQNKRGEFKSVTVRLSKNPIEVATDNNNLPTRMSIEAYIPVGRNFQGPEFDKEIGTLHISLPESPFIRKYYLLMHPDVGPGAYLEVGDRKRYTGESAGIQKSGAVIEIGSPATYRQRIMELTFDGAFFHAGPTPNEPVIVKISFRLSY